MIYLKHFILKSVSWAQWLRSVISVSVRLKLEDLSSRSDWAIVRPSLKTSEGAKLHRNPVSKNKKKRKENKCWNDGTFLYIWQCLQLYLYLMITYGSSSVYQMITKPRALRIRNHITSSEIFSDDVILPHF